MVWESGSTERPDEKKLHARITYNGKVGTDYVRRKIQERCSLTETDVTAVLDALSHVLGRTGRRTPSASGRDRLFSSYAEMYRRGDGRDETQKYQVRLKGIKFRADQVLKNEIGAIKLNR